eukprot:4925710-Pleurochrysis_carterae.AAC.1
MHASLSFTRLIADTCGTDGGARAFFLSTEASVFPVERGRHDSTPLSDRSSFILARTRHLRSSADALRRRVRSKSSGLICHDVASIGRNLLNLYQLHSTNITICTDVEYVSILLLSAATSKAYRNRIF